MAAYFRLGLLLVLLGLTTALPAQVLQMLQPIKQVDSIPAGQTADWIILVRNAGAAPVHVTVVPDCGVSLVESSSTLIQPGLRGRYVLRVHSNGRRGSFERNVLVYGSDGGRPAEARFRFAVGRPLVSPTVYRDTVGGLAFNTLRETVYPGLVEGGAARRVTFRVRNVSRKPIRFLDSLMQGQPFQLSPNPALLDPGQEGEIVAQYRSLGLAYLDTNAGADAAFLIPLTLHTDEPGSPVKTLRIAGTYTPASRSLPIPPVWKPEIDAGRLNSQARPVFTFTLQNLSRDTVRITSIRLTDRVRLLNRITSLPPRSAATLRVQLDGRNLLGPVHRTVTLQGDFGTQVLHLRAIYPGRVMASRYRQ